MHVHIDPSVKRCLAQITGALQSIVMAPGSATHTDQRKKCNSKFAGDSDVLLISHALKCEIE